MSYKYCKQGEKNIQIQADTGEKSKTTVLLLMDFVGNQYDMLYYVIKLIFYHFRFGKFFKGKCNLVVTLY